MVPIMKKAIVNFSILFAFLAVLAATPQLTQAKEKININTATVEQLVTIKGIGDKTAAYIVQFREDVGPYKNVDELIMVKGVGAKKLEKMRSLITVGEEETH